jgi:hypothetical protein
LAGRGSVACQAVVADHRVKAALGEGQDHVAVLGAADVHALAAQDAAVGVVIYAGVAAVDLRLLEALRELAGL